MGNIVIYVYHIVFFVLLTSVIAMLSPILNSYIIDQGIVARNLQVVIKYTLIILGLFIIEQVVEFIELRQCIYINNMLSTNLLLKAFRHTLKLRMSYHYETNIFFPKRIIHRTVIDYIRI